MEKFKGIASGGWHPGGGKGGSSSSSSNPKSGGSFSDSFKGVSQVKGWMGKGGNNAREDASDHQTTPLSSLRDPATFAPPPKRLDYSGTSASPSAPRPPPIGLGAPISQQEAQPAYRAMQTQVEEEAEPPPLPGPYRADTTGLNTAHLPKPPVRRTDREFDSSTAPSQQQKPKLPPRLPPRRTQSPASPLSPPPTYNDSVQQSAQGGVNQEALKRLGQAGVSVSGFNIGRNASPPVPSRFGVASPPAPVESSSSLAADPQLNELQSRFSKLSTGSSPESASGTTWAQKQEALRTASTLRNDPLKVTSSDVRGAASTAQNFQQRHGDQVASGWKSANGLNQKYGIMDKVNSYSSGGAQATSGSTVLASPTSGQAMGVVKKPPPPPPKKRELGGEAISPPPVPLGSKPKPHRWQG